MWPQRSCNAELYGEPVHSELAKMICDVSVRDLLSVHCVLTEHVFLQWFSATNRDSVKMQTS